MPEELAPLKLPLLVFGIGPVLDKNTRIRAEDANTKPNQEDVPFWSHNLAKAAAKLYSMGAVSQIVVMGGQTGGKKYKSESEIIKKLLTDLDLPESSIFIERRSVETIENIVNFINEFTNSDSDPSNLRVNILCAEYHTARTAILMKFFAIRVKDVFASEEILRFVARNESVNELRDIMTDQMKQDNEKILNKIEAILDPTPRHSFYDEQHGDERINYHDRIVAEGFWTREILMLPERILFQAAGILNDRQLHEIVRIAQSVYGTDMDKYEIATEKDTPDEVRAKMRRYPWPYILEGKTPEEMEKLETEKRKAYKDKWMDEYEHSGWPKEVSEREERLRNFNLYS